MAKKDKREIEEAFLKHKNIKKEMVEKNRDIKGKHTRILIRPLLRFALWAQRKLKGQTVTIMGNENYQLPNDRPVLFSVTHIGKYDFEIVNEQIKEQFYVIASDFRNMYGNFNGFMMNCFGCYFVDEVSKEDRKCSSLLLQKILKTKVFGKNLNGMLFSEGTWNLSENEPVYEPNFGAVDIAMSTNALILPIGIEQYGKHFIVNFGDFYDPTKIVQENTNKKYCDLDETNEKDKLLKLKIKLIANKEMRDRLATLKFEIWESKGIQKRSEIPNDYWEKYVEERLSEWPGYSMQEQIDSVYHPKEKLTQQQVEQDLKNLTLNDKNYFMFTNPNRIDDYIDALNRCSEIEQEIISHRDTVLEQEPIEIRLKKYKQYKKTIIKDDKKN